MTGFKLFDLSEGAQELARSASSHLTKQTATKQQTNNQGKRGGAILVKYKWDETHADLARQVVQDGGLGTSAKFTNSALTLQYPSSLRTPEGETSIIISLERDNNTPVSIRDKDGVWQPLRWRNCQAIILEEGVAIKASNPETTMIIMRVKYPKKDTAELEVGAKN